MMQKLQMVKSYLISEMMKIKNQRKTYRKKIDEKRCVFFYHY